MAVDMESFMENGMARTFEICEAPLAIAVHAPQSPEPPQNSLPATKSVLSCACCFCVVSYASVSEKALLTCLNWSVWGDA
jgi:hypothetical protein